MSALTISPEDEKRVKGMGFLNNRGTDLFSARVLTTNGKVTAAQHRCMADAAEKFGNGELLYTTRLSVEIPGIPYDKIEEFQKFIAKEGLVTGGTGAKVRPVVSCKGPPVSMDFWIPTQYQKKFTDVFMKVTGRLHFHINLRLLWGAVQTTV